MTSFRTSWWWISWAFLMGLLGYALGQGLDHVGIWRDDEGLLTQLGVRAEPLPTLAASKLSESSATGLRFDDISDSGIASVYDNGPENVFHLAETLGGGVGAIDFDLDGHADLVFVDGGDPVHWPQNQTLRVSLFRNRGDGRFIPVSLDSRLSWTGYGHGCAVADVNNDGFDDVLLTGYQHSALYLNLGDGTFTESPVLQPLIGERWCATACWSDLDRDGDLDLYIACYADSARDVPPPICESKGIRVHCNPHSYHPVPDLLFENTGDGGFVDRSESSGIARYREYGLGVIAADLNRDGSPEIFVANDGDRNLLFRRTSDWAYEEIALASGVAFNGQGETMGSMGVACADFDRNGRLDLFTTNFSNESNALFHQLEDLAFSDNTQGTAIDRTSRPRVGWAAVVLDANCDRFLDLFVANGHVTGMPNEDWPQFSSLLQGTSTGEFQEVQNAGPWFGRRWHARGACRTDLNRDGLEDLVVSLIDDPAAILKNTTPTAGHRISLRFIGTTSPRTPEGTLIEIESASGTTLHLVSRNAGYLSSNGPVSIFGLGPDTVADVIRITWPSGHVQELHHVPAGSNLIVVEDRPTAVESTTITPAP